MQKTLSEYDNLDLYQIFINVCQVSERVVRLCDYISRDHRAPRGV